MSLGDQTQRFLLASGEGLEEHGRLTSLGPVLAQSRERRVPFVGRHQLFAGERQLDDRDQIRRTTLLANNNRGAELEKRCPVESVLRASEAGDDDVGRDGPFQDDAGVVPRAQVEIEQEYLRSQIDYEIPCLFERFRIGVSSRVAGPLEQTDNQTADQELIVDNHNLDGLERD